MATDALDGLWLLLLIPFVVAGLWALGFLDTETWRDWSDRFSATTTPNGQVEPPIEELAVRRPPTLIRVYKGNQQQDAIRRFQSEAATLARVGYHPTSQSWAQGQWGCGAFLLALLLAVVLIGILIFIYMLIVKPEGTLTVTYELRGGPSARDVSAISSGPAATRAGASLRARLAQLEEAYRAGLVTEPEYKAKREDILSGL